MQYENFSYFVDLDCSAMEWQWHKDFFFSFLSAIWPKTGMFQTFRSTYAIYSMLVLESNAWCAVNISDIFWMFNIVIAFSLYPFIFHEVWALSPDFRWRLYYYYVPQKGCATNTHQVSCLFALSTIIHIPWSPSTVARKHMTRTSVLSILCLQQTRLWMFVLQ